MATRNANYLKRIITKIPDEFVVDSRWLESHGVSRFLSREYVNAGWLTRVAPGLFKKPSLSQSTTLDTARTLLSMQHFLQYDFHLGGYSALALSGFAHFLHLDTHSKGQTWLFGEHFPQWLYRVNLDTQVHTRRRSLFSDTTLGITSRTIPQTGSGLELRTAAPERAILEMLDELDGSSDFDFTDKVFQSLTVLRPRLLTELLHDCRKIKVKRLFFVFADRHNYPWRKAVQPADFDLGSGDRALVPGGKLHPMYRIVVPEELLVDGRPTNY